MTPLSKAANDSRVSTDGKFLLLGGRTFRVRGATYGSFGPRADGEPFPEPAQVADDFRAMAEAGLNTVRTYALPPSDVLDLAAEHDLHVLVGLHYHDWRLEERSGWAARRRILDAGCRAVADAVERCADRPEVLALSVGNEVPGDLVRLHGIGSVEETLSALIAEIHASGTPLLATYTNYPTTEYLHVDGKDIYCVNVFLEEPEDFEAYLRHLQIVSGEKPLVITELGLAADLHGQSAQADALAWQLRLVDETGCAGATVFSWTDAWNVGGSPVSGWGFGLTDEERRPKPALDVVRAWTQSTTADLRSSWPSVSVVVCARNEAALVEHCLGSLERCEYPNFEVIFCDDGSTDRTLELARRFPFRVLALEHGGLSRARNAGIEAATGEIVAFLDADAECHPEWPYHLALSLKDTNVAGTGGPNLPPSGAPFSERAVSLSPGAPMHVLVTDDRAEHVPGCNMAFRKSALQSAGCFDPIYRAAGDDVDVCWKLLDRGHEIAFAPAAQVRHHRPATISGYLRQQRNYGRAERMLSGRHPHRFNRMGQARWSGFMYSTPRILPALLRPIVYHGSMGLAPFQPVARRRSEALLSHSMALLPVLALPFLLGALAVLSLWWLLAPALALLAVAGYAGAVATAVHPVRGEPHPVRLRALVAWLHVAQPFVRTWGRLRGKPADRALPHHPGWSGDRTAWLVKLLRELDGRRCRVREAGPHDDWDLAISVGLVLSCRLTTAIAWNWAPRHRVAYRLRPIAPAVAVAVGALAYFAPLWAAVAGAALLALLAVEAVLLRRLLGQSVAATTQGASK